MSPFGGGRGTFNQGGIFGALQINPNPEETKTSNNPF